MMTVAVLSLVAAGVLASVSSRYNSAYRSSAWNDALLAAESGVDTTISQVTGLLPDVQASANGLGVGYTQPSLNFFSATQLTPTSLVTDGTLVNLILPSLGTLNDGSEGGTTQQSSVSLEVVSLNQVLGGGLLTPNNLHLLRLHSTGTVTLTGGTVAAPSRQDNDLWRPSLVTDRMTGQALSQPTVARQIEVILRPVYPFEAAVVSNGTVQAADAGTVFDSFNSSLPLASHERSIRLRQTDGGRNGGVERGQRHHRR